MIEKLGEGAEVRLLERWDDGPSPESLRAKSSMVNLIVDPTFRPFIFLNG